MLSLSTYLSKLSILLSTLMALTIFCFSQTGLTHEEKHDSLRDTVSRSTMKKASKALKPEQKQSLEQAFKSTHDSKKYTVSKKLLKYSCGKDGVCECNFAFDCVDMALHANCKKETVTCNFVSCTCNQQSKTKKSQDKNKEVTEKSPVSEQVEEKEGRKKPSFRRQSNL